jgi:hypothetical protein
MSLIRNVLVLTVCFGGWNSAAESGGMSSKLLLSSAWCSFSYNQISGYSHTQRVRFSADGTFRVGGRNEGQSSNKYGSVAGQSDTAGGGYWRVQNGELFMSDGGPLQQVSTLLKYNSSGVPIVVGDGKEYVACN